MNLNSAIKLFVPPMRPATTEDRRKAEILIGLAKTVSAGVLERAGFSVDETELWNANLLASSMNENELPYFHPVDCFSALRLNNIPPLLSLTKSNWEVNHLLLFGNGRVVEWDFKKVKSGQIMSYEDAARLIVLWLMDKILQIIRENKWDRVKVWPDLFDRLAQLVD